MSDNNGAVAAAPPVPPVHGIRSPAPVNLMSDTAENWKLFKQKWKNYATITQLGKQPVDHQVALLLHTIGDDALRIYNGFTFDTDDNTRSVDEILAKFDSFAVGEANECYERFIFNNRNQQAGETFEQFLTAIRVLIKSCNFCDDCRNSILLRGSKVVIPTSLRDQAVSLAHEGHQGMAKTKELIRSKVWFPKMNDKVETAVRQCFACQCTYNGHPHLEPMQMSNMPVGPWRKLSVDFLGPLPSGEELMVLVDEYSRYPVVEIVRSVSANNVIPVLDKVLTTFGYPEVIKSDNGPPFNSEAFSSFAKHSGFRHRRVTEYWPRGNAQAEGFNKPLMKAIRSAVLEQKNWKQAMYQFLRQYRATPHTSTKFSPHHLLFGREPATKLPYITVNDDHDHNEIHAAARRNDEQAKQTQKTYADHRNRATHNDLQVGDTVLMRNDKKSNKLSTPFSPKPMVITNIKGTAVTAANDKHTIRRNASRFKKMFKPLPVWNKKVEIEKVPDTVDIPKMTTVTPVTHREKSQPNVLYTRTPTSRDVNSASRTSMSPNETPKRQRPQRRRYAPRRLDDYAL